MASSDVSKIRAFCIIFAVCILIVLIVILSLQWRKVDAVVSTNQLNVGLLYNSGKKSVELDKLYTPGRYYVGAGSYFLEFPSIQKTIIFRSDAKQNFDTNGAFISPVIRGLTK